MRRSENGTRGRGCHRTGSEPLTGECDHCQWQTAQSSYPAVVKAYQDHLREHHHDVWVRT
jgi:hypothetical protein